MGQTVSKEDVRLAELQSIMRDAQLRLSRLQPLAAAEEAANDAPTPQSSQAAYYAARQRLAVAADEYRAISRQLGEALRALPPFPHALLWQGARWLWLAQCLCARIWPGFHCAGRAASPPPQEAFNHIITCPARLPLLLQPSCAVETPTLLPCPRQRRHFRPKVRGVVCMEPKLELLCLPPSVPCPHLPSCLPARDQKPSWGAAVHTRACR